MPITLKAPSKTSLERIELLILLLNLPLVFFAFLGLAAFNVNTGPLGYMLLSDKIPSMFVLPLSLLSLYIIAFIDERNWCRLWPFMLPMFVTGVIGLLIMGLILIAAVSNAIEGKYSGFMIFGLFLPITGLGAYKCYRFIRLALLKKPA